MITSQPLLGNDVTTALDEQEEVEPAELVNSIFENLSAYFAAESIAKKLIFVRDPGRAKDLMADYYQRNEIMPKELVRILSQTSLSLGFHE